MESVIQPVLDENGNIKEFIVLRKDITHLINAEKLINDKLKFIKEALLVFVKIDHFADLEIVYDEDTLQKLKTRLVKRVKNFLRGFFIECPMENYDVQKDIFTFLIKNFEKDALDKIFQIVVKEIGNRPLTINGFDYYPQIKISYTNPRNKSYIFKHLFQPSIIQ
ncbi:hypothetical protein [Nautilia sp.]